MTFRVFKF